ncbi:hypothetical protein E8A74_48070 [Polyangium fumosum]|uniref:Macro domain-containing protein n=1 Tax=Polyangium fumosum TaxID=889272 RepID=A0A4U1IL88_9BACT|nr:hypothetical protein E8A74_48070 [Polyangium fumosum]
MAAACCSVHMLRLLPAGSLGTRDTGRQDGGGRGDTFMDGGVDRAYAAFFGPAFERLVYDAVARRPDGFLPVGAAEIVPTGHARIPYVLLAPTMLMPEHVSASHAYRALRAALRVAARESKIEDLYCPGLATGVGGVEPDDAAREMAAAYADATRANA